MMVYAEIYNFILEKEYYSRLDSIATYEEDTTLYSQIQKNYIFENVGILDKALEFCVEDNRRVIENADLLMAALYMYERILNEDYDEWTDNKLNVSYATLSHVYGSYRKELWIKFDEIREALLTNCIIEKEIAA